MTATLATRNDALAAYLAANANDPKVKALVLDFTKAKAEALTAKHQVKSLGVSMTLAQVAITYQAYKSVPNSLGESARAYAKAISTECLAIIKKTGYKADWAGIQDLASHA